ncbi:PREDICTED: uncharacterized protein LOC109219477 [Nicotiana attenuata]|uniref:Uncharacterized protein n=1 Tax=Nicotiana attenuata TaxID=49451 RepID=A0A1J6IM67_NICAT|nr:PREDICTED: uncharacterized protein LOC109219477 [Nicotiana attenuata]OIT06245.1 hypothetical protein A4A49_53577 [Nicotiana attenuata]
MTSPKVTLKDLHSFHFNDRELFMRLVMILYRNPAESLLVMALWFWLQNHAHFTNALVKIAKAPNIVLNSLSNEASTCLKCLQSMVPPMANPGGQDMPLTTLITDGDISFQIVYQTRFTMISGIKHYLNNVFSIVFADILLQLFPGRSRILLNSTFGSIEVVPRTLDYIIPTEEGPLDSFWSLNPAVPVEDRTLFLTFSKGYPVTEAEVIDLFNSKYRDCIEDIHMVPSTTLDHSLYARMVVRDVSTVDQILSTCAIAKFRINEKHVWARKYERRDKHF